MGHVHPSMLATQVESGVIRTVVKKLSLASLFILWVPSAAMAVTSALVNVFRFVVKSLTYQSGSLSGDLRSNFVRARASKSGAKSAPKTFFTARFVA